MKKLMTSIAALVLFAGISNAAETTVSNRNSPAVVSSATDASSLISAKSVTQVIEENAELRLKVETLEMEAENMSSLLDYSKMMHVTIGNLQETVAVKQQEDTRSQLDFARMMTTTLLNLSTQVNSK